MNTVILKEEAICKLLDSRDPYALKARDDNQLRPTVHPTLISAIYFERTPEEHWKLNPRCNICDTTGNRYRKMYIKHFYYFYERNKALAEAAATDGQ